MRDEARGAWRPSPLIMAALLLQLALLVVGILLLLYAGGGASAWLMALLLGSSFNLLLVVLQPCRWARGQLKAPDEPLAKRPDAHAVKPDTVAEPTATEARLRRQVRDLQDDLAHRKQRLSRLMAGRERTRESSRLKSDYLSLMGRELRRLRLRLDELASEHASNPDADASMVDELRERLAGMNELLEGLVGEGGSSSTRPTARQGRVLIVDDGPVNLMLAQQVLEREGLRVTAVTSGSEALACQAQEHFDLVLMDIFMEGMDGMETSRRWREQERAGHVASGSVLVALTANVSDDDRRRFIEAGLDDVLAKPYRPQELVERVTRWLPEHLAEPEA
ncbi:MULTISPECIES: response regulator [unclassified Halomonas]|uniref:response regulator n=1 Tax=unclassified Halomonas TaxID=2609666 RepID=UPI002887DB40|nr:MULTISPECIES: response regulator [unclassified Halomonas]MDT0501029.1 response regulator [Halomonas sp. PAR7]MDT0513220.1 response regulator [Halomonas sp. LES1]MDT0593011.1 response regulator [Halomonas sp. PAR8]